MRFAITRVRRGVAVRRAAERKAMNKYWGILVAGSLAACASNNAQPPASSATVAEASSTPTTGADFAPASNDGMAAAPSEPHATHEMTAEQKAASSKPMAPTGNDVAPPSAAAPPVSNAAAMPGQDTPSAPDNSRVNARDKNAAALTPMDQGTSESDRKITQQIRQSVVKDGSLSFTAKNVKIITINGKVTLRGPVKTAAERTAIEAAAKNVAGVGQVDNQLDVKN